MPTTARDRGFTLIEVLASIAAFTIVFLAGFGGIGKLLLTQDQNYARTVAASAAMIMADWHVRTALGSATATTLIGDDCNTSATDTTWLLAQVPTANLGSVKFHGYDNALSTNDTYYRFNSQPSVPRAVDLRNPSGNLFTPSDYQCLLVGISGASTKEGDSKMTFRQVSFWYGPPQVIQDLQQTGPQSITLELVGRFVLPDKYGP